MPFALKLTRKWISLILILALSNVFKLVSVTSAQTISTFAFRQFD